MELIYNKKLLLFFCELWAAKRDQGEVWGEGQTLALRLLHRLRFCKRWRLQLCTFAGSRLFSTLSRPSIESSLIFGEVSKCNSESYNRLPFTWKSVRASLCPQCALLDVIDAQFYSTAVSDVSRLGIFWLVITKSEILASMRTFTLAKTSRTVLIWFSMINLFTFHSH